MTDTVEYMVLLKGEYTPRRVDFKDLKLFKEDMVALIMMWNHNSYLVNVKHSYFVINGGRKIGVPRFADIENRCIEYYKRNQIQVGTNGEELGQNQSYLLGMVGDINSVKQEIYLHISPDGSHWVWKATR